MAQHDDERHGKRGVRRHRHAPALGERPGRDHGNIKKGGNHHAADRAGNRQGGATPAGQVADGELALDLKPDDQEEDGQQPVVDPVA